MSNTNEGANGDGNWDTGSQINQNIQIQIKKVELPIISLFYIWGSIHYKTAYVTLTSFPEWPIFPIHLLRFMESLACPDTVLGTQR